MFPILSPAEAMRLSIRTAMMMTEAQLVISMRILGMMGMWNIRPTENAKMVSEKIATAQKAGLAMQKTMLRGGSPAQVASAGLSPVARKTQSNVKRLARRGPAVPS